MSGATNSPADVTPSYDVVAYGATPAGLMREFHERIRALYTREYGASSEQAEACSDGFFFEPHVAERICRDEHGESLAGVRYPPEQEANADGKTQGYGFRLCLTTDTKNLVPVREPPTYDPALYSFRRAPAHRGQAPRVRRGLPVVPAHRRGRAEGVPGQLATYGYAKDEFIDNQHWPSLMYIREARRMVGDFVMTQQDVTDDGFEPDAVPLGSFFLDVHPVRYVPEPTAPGGMVTEGELAEATRPYEIPYRAAAAISVQDSVPVHDVPVGRLQDRLRKQGQILDATPSRRPGDDGNFRRVPTDRVYPR